MDTPTVIFHSDISTDQSISSLLSGIVPPQSLNLTLTVEELIRCPNIPRSVQRRHTDIARPPNCFMLYRKNFLAQIRNSGLEEPFNMSALSKEAGARWREEPPEVVNFFTQLAEV